MIERSPIVVLLLGAFTGGIYSLIWYVKTKDEMVSRGADIPTAWYLIIPILNLLWLWKWGQGVEKVTNGEMSAVVALILLIMLGPIGMFVVQGKFNAVAGGAPA